jgi:hypothetical protein
MSTTTCTIANSLSVKDLELYPDKRELLITGYEPKVLVLDDDWLVKNHKQPVIVHNLAFHSVFFYWPIINPNCNNENQSRF